MNIIGEKVILRAIEFSDCNMLRKLMNDPETEYLLGGWSFPVSEEEQRHWCESFGRSKETLRVMIDVNDTTVGTAILSDIDLKNGSAQIHIKLINSECRNKGYGTDTVNALVSYAFDELRLHCIYAQVSQHNVASQKLFAKCGFMQEGMLRDRLYKRGKYINVIIFSLLGDKDA